ncbi:hypothetical protein CHLNCDRAFT_52990 [Chlorella variabilis]|uniref:Uncharacterized protein n=1 Tax=Chlorella variabilis TaxID=554065 RepID=E1ZHV4_CHLVA|nr:hypothetical protein CHLNCDRAFT_52990 [Chlorella variabilis]EFN54669.1 hypothetical protein CHLNCDRAFT_52990 [Chlorella variabilis]|eukprot:XP_005846771.1 hypothetical protein CHLNCDRAFT_52990 [Chlorella variabilis]
MPTRLLSPQEALDALYESQHAAQRTTYRAFYSSELGGIVTDPALFVVQLDDHMLHRGHGVFDTAMLVNGHLYQLDQHLHRFLASAAKANIPLPPGMTVEQMRRTILETTAASCKLNGHVRYWLSAGRGGFGLSGNECLGSAFYCVVYTQEVPDSKLDEYLRGWRVKTSPVPLKPPFFTGIKSNNYLPNALNLMDAEAEGFDQGVFVDAEGNVSEGPNMNVACLLADGTLVVPPFDHSLNGITVQRMMELLPAAIEEGMEGIKRVEQRHISLAEAKAATEVFFISSSMLIMPVVQWDTQLIADGTAGIVALQIRVMLQNDTKPRPASDQHTEVPYGFMTGMEEA